MMADLRKLEAVCPRRTIARTPHHHDFPTPQDGFQSSIAETPIRSVTTTPHRHESLKTNKH